jgi:ABC-type cobalamin/Fe3+-siderophores transport system ATPase subunit
MIVKPDQFIFLYGRDLCYSITTDCNVYQNIDIQFKNGDWVIVSGSNGVGKSTLVKQLAGFPLSQVSGELALFWNEQRIPNAIHPLLSGLIAPYIALPSYITYQRYIHLLQLSRMTHIDLTKQTELLQRFKIQHCTQKRLGVLRPSHQILFLILIALLFKQPVLLFDEIETWLDTASLEQVCDYIHHERNNHIIIWATKRPTEIPSGNRSIHLSGTDS